jgi:hypothetical protein
MQCIAHCTLSSQGPNTLKSLGQRAARENFLEQDEMYMDHGTFLNPSSIKISLAKGHPNLDAASYISTPFFHPQFNACASFLQATSIWYHFPKPPESVNRA